MTGNLSICCSAPLEKEKEIQEAGIVHFSACSDCGRRYLSGVEDSSEKLDWAHGYCSCNKDPIENYSNEVGCFFCVDVYDADEVEEYVGVEGTTALCPSCGIDALLPGFEAEEFVDEDFLSAMHSEFFSKFEELKNGD